MSHFLTWHITLLASGPGNMHLNLKWPTFTTWPMVWTASVCLDHVGWYVFFCDQFVVKIRHNGVVTGKLLGKMTFKFTESKLNILHVTQTRMQPWWVHGAVLGASFTAGNSTQSDPNKNTKQKKVPMGLKSKHFLFTRSCFSEQSNVRITLGMFPPSFNSINNPRCLSQALTNQCNCIQTGVQGLKHL